MSIQLDNNQFTILVKKYLDDRQYIKTLEELNNIDDNRYPAGLIVYCEEDKNLYKRNNDSSWIKVDIDAIEPYLFLYDEEGDTVIPNENKPIYSSIKKIGFDDILTQFINKEEYLQLEENGIYVSLEVNTDDDKMYSQSSIEVQITNADKAGKDYLTKKLLDVVKPGFEEVSDVTEMTDSGTFYLLESALNPGQYAMYIIDEEGAVVPLGSKQMSLSNYQHLEDKNLETEDKTIAGAINELFLQSKVNASNIGNVSTIKIEEHSDTIVDALNYCQLILNKLGELDDLTLELLDVENPTLVDFLNKIDEISGPLNKLNTTNRNNFVSSLNSFYGTNVPPGSIFPYMGSEAPDGYLMCDGSAYELSDYPRLYSAIGFNFGVGDSSTLFKVPDMTDKIIVGYDAEDEEFNTVGKLGGQGYVTLEAGQIPSHRHTIKKESHKHYVYTSGNTATIYYTNVGSNRDSKNSGYSTGSTSTGYRTATWNHRHYFTGTYNGHYHDMYNAGGGIGHENCQPHIRLNFIIKY